MASKMNLTENGLLCHRWTPHSDKIPQYIFYALNLYFEPYN